MMKACLGIILFEEKRNLTYWIGLTIVFLGTVILNGSKTDEAESENENQVKKTT
jgi:multidrug transporter EmrE-like cation transporter